MKNVWRSERFLGTLYRSASSCLGKHPREAEQEQPYKVARTTVQVFIHSNRNMILFVLRQRINATFSRRVHEPCGDFEFGLHIRKRNDAQALITPTSDGIPIHKYAFVVGWTDTDRINRSLDQVAAISF